MAPSRSAPRALRSGPAPRLALLGALALGWIVTGLRTSLAQDGAPSASSEDLTVAALEAKLQQLEAETAVEATQKEALVQHTKEALEWARKAAQHDAWIRERKPQITSAPQELEAVRESIRKTKEAEPTVDATNLTLEEIETAELGARTRREAAQTRVENHDADLSKHRPARRTAIPESLATLATKVTELDARITATTAQDLDPRIRDARLLALRSERRALGLEEQRLQTELAYYDATRELVRAKREQAALESDHAQRELAQWRGKLQEARAVRAREELDSARSELERAEANGFGPWIDAAARNVELVRTLKGDRPPPAEEDPDADPSTDPSPAEEPDDPGVQALKAERDRNLADLNNRVSSEQQRLELLRKSVEIAGLTRDAGRTLREARDGLRPIEQLEARIRSRQVQIAELGTRIFELQEERRGLSDIDREVRRRIDALGADAPRGEQRRQLELELRTALESTRALNTELYTEYTEFLTTLEQLDLKDEEYVALIREFRRFIDVNVLWIPSHDWMNGQDWSEARQRVDGLVEDLDGDAWRGSSVTRLLSIAGCWILLLTARRLLHRRLRYLHLQVSHVKTDAFMYSPRALVVCAAIAAVPALLWYSTLQLLLPTVDSSSALDEAIFSTALSLFVLELVRTICAPRGLADLHFRWGRRTILRLRRITKVLLLIGLPIFFVERVLQNIESASSAGAASRPAFLLLHLLMTCCVWYALSPTHGIFADVAERGANSLWNRLGRMTFTVSVCAPAALAAISVAGWHGTAIHLSPLLSTTAWIVFAMLVIQGMVLRWSYVERRRLAVALAERRTAEAAAASTDESAAEAPPEIDVYALGEQTRKLLQAFVALGLVLGVWLLWRDVLPALNFLDRVDLWFHEGTVEVENEDGSTSTTEGMVPVTLGNLLMALVFIALTAIATLHIPAVLDILLLTRLPLTAGSRYAWATVTRYGVVVFGVLAAFDRIGIGWGTVQWLVAAVSFGLGFGLQEIFANFVSGLILLFERPIRVGDVVTVGDVSGTVTRIRMRATTISDFDRKELVVPNKTFITDRLINWSLTDPTTRLTIKIGVAYGTDTRPVQAILLRIARAHPLVLRDPKPEALFLSFGDSSLNFELRVFVAHISDRIPTVHAIHDSIHREFAAAGITIPFPQRDVHFDRPPAEIPSPDERPG